MEPNLILKKLRIDKNLTQKELAELIHVSESTVQKWEARKNRIGITEIQALCNALNVTIDVFFPENIKKAGGTSMLEQLIKCNPEAPKTIEYLGLKETTAGLKAFMDDYENNTEREYYSGESNKNWDILNHFSVLYDTDTDSINGIRDFGQYMCDGTDFIFRTKYIPVRVPQGGTQEYVQQYVNETKLLFENWVNSSIESAHNQNKKPAFLVRSACNNDYYAWSYDEGEYIYVLDYKSYRQNFKIADCYDELPNLEEENYRFVNNRGQGSKDNSSQ